MDLRKVYICFKSLYFHSGIHSHELSVYREGTTAAMMQKCSLEAIPSASYGLEFKEFLGK